MSTDTRTGPSRRHAWSGPTMGARWSATAWVRETLDPAALQHRLQAVVDEVDRQMSTWRADSDLNRLNAAPVGDWVDVPAELCAVLETALAVGRASAGAFDIGVGDLVRAWGFGGGRRAPDPTLIRATTGRPTFEPPKSLLVDASRHRVRKLAPLVLDLSGIAKGFGVDELGRVLAEAGLSSWLVGIDGEMRAAGRKPDGRPWVVAHEAPVPGRRDLAGVLTLVDAAVATSGAYRHQAELDGGTVSHTMDPRQGAPLAGDVASVTVVAPTCMEADAWATAILVAGLREGEMLARSAGLGVVLTRRDGRMVSTI